MKGGEHVRIIMDGDPKEIAAVVAERTHSQVVQVIGKKIILYKPDKKNPKIMLDKI